MTLDEALEAMRAADSGVPNEAIQAALDAGEAAVDPIVAVIEACSGTASPAVPDANLAFLGAHVLAEMGAARALGPLCRLLRRPDRGEEVFGDALDLSMPALLAALCDDGWDRLRALVEDPDADESARGIALRALVPLVEADGARRDEVHAWLRDLFRTLKARKGAYVWMCLAKAVAALDLADLAPQARLLFAKRMIDQDYYAQNEFSALVREMRDPERRREELEAFAGEDGDGAEPGLPQPGGWRRDEFDGDWQTPTVNPVRHVGRNDPCPCGSGKKYKRCCLELAG